MHFTHKAVADGPKGTFPIYFRAFVFRNVANLLRINRVLPLTGNGAHRKAALATPHNPSASRRSPRRKKHTKKGSGLRGARGSGGNGNGRLSTGTERIGKGTSKQAPVAKPNVDSARKMLILEKGCHFFFHT